MKQTTRAALLALIFIAPWVIGFLVFTLIPMGSSLYYSFMDYNIVAEPVYVGLDNYSNLFFNDTDFWGALGNTLYMLFFGLASVTIVTFSISILMNDRRVRGLSFFRVVFFIPTLVPLVILAILWIWILQPDVGMVNSILAKLGIQGPGWFASPAWAKPSFILMMIWGSGNMIIIYLAGLQEIPQTLFEAAEIDGAKFLQKVFHITIPLMRPVILFNVVTGIINVLQSFAEAFIITNGGPDNATNFYSLYLYRNAFPYLKMGYASAMAWILLVISILGVFLLFRWERKFRNDL